jgi:hypothetical protein
VTGAVVPFLRGDPQVRFPDTIKDLAFALWSTYCGGDGAATERMLAKELDDGTPIPTRQTIARWAREDGWVAQRDEGWRNLKGRTVYELRAAMLSNVALAQKIKRDAMTGAFDDDVQAGALRLKGAELADRLLERAVIALAVPEPPADGTADDLSGLTRAEREARANEEMQRRKQGRG